MTSTMRFPSLGNYSGQGRIIDKKNHSKNLFNMKNYQQASKDVQIE